MDILNICKKHVDVKFLKNYKWGCELKSDLNVSSSSPCWVETTKVNWCRIVVNITPYQSCHCVSQTTDTMETMLITLLYILVALND